MGIKHTQVFMPTCLATLEFFNKISLVRRYIQAAYTFPELTNNKSYIDLHLYYWRANRHNAVRQVFRQAYVKLDNLYLTTDVNMGYNVLMFCNAISFTLRIALIVAIWALIWRLIESQTQSARILRAALLLLSLLTVLAVMRITG